MIDNGYELAHGELWHIFNKMYKSKSPEYNKLGKAIIYLLDELKSEKRERLVYLLNNNFKFKYLDDGYTYQCDNPLVAKHLIKLAKSVKGKNIEILSQYL